MSRAANLIGAERRLGRVIPLRLRRFRSRHVRVFIHPIHGDHVIILTHGARPRTAAELRRDARLERRLRVRHADVRTPTREIGLVRVRGRGRLRGGSARARNRGQPGRWLFCARSSDVALSSHGRAGESADGW